MGGGSDFSYKKGGVGKIGGCFTKGRVPLIFILTFSGVKFLEVFDVCVLFVYTISISIICVSQEEPSLIAPNQQMYDFYKRIIFEKKKILWKVKF